MLLISSRIVFTVILTSVSFSMLAQYSSFKEEYKKELWKTIKPSKPTSLPSAQDPKESLIKSEDLIDNKYIKAYNKSKYSSSALLDIVQDKYKVNPEMLIYRGAEPANKLPPGSTTLVYMGGHFYFVSNAGMLVFPSGLNFGGSPRKTLSAKSRAIIENVFGMEIEK